MTTPAIICPELLEYLRLLLDQAQKGRVIFFAGSALVFDPDNPGDSTVVVGAITSGHLQVLGERALRSSLAATNDGLARGAKILFDAVEQEMDLRQPKILM